MLRSACRDSMSGSDACSAGSFGVACVVDGEGEFIVAVVCTTTCPDAEVLLKAKEVAHGMKVGHK